MSIYNKVSELEWYLCQKALLKEFLSKNAYEKYLSDLDRFHAEWEGLHEPKIVETENKSALAVYSPINAMLVLSPGAELNLPLGYVLPKDFLWMQIYPDTLLFSEGKTSGAVKVNGSILKLTNISDESIQLPLCKEAAIGLGMTKEQRDNYQKYERFQLVELHPENPLPELGFYLPGIYKSGLEGSDYIPSNFYMTVSKKQQVRFMIHRKNGITCDPSSDPILDIITVDDIWKYSVKQTADEGLPYDVQKLFEQKWKAIAGKNTFTVIERLDIKEFKKSRKVNGMFSCFARGKTQEALMKALNWKGYDFVEVAPEFTSQVCPVCGNLDSANRDGKRFKCICCGHEDDADHVGSINIRERAVNKDLMDICEKHRYGNGLQNALKDYYMEQNEIFKKQHPQGMVS